MKTLNLNKFVLLTVLSLAGLLFSNSASALCVVNGDGAIVTVSGNSTTPVKDDTGDEETAANTATTDCTITPDVYKLNIYKFGLCKSDPDLNDLSSCQLFFDQAAGVELDIQKGVSATLPIPEFSIEPGTYPYLYVLLSSKLGMKWSGRMSNAVDGSSGDGNGGTYCWTSNTGMRASNPPSDNSAMTSAHGTTLAGSVKTLDCGTSEGTVVFTYEVLTKFSDSDCDSALAANGDKNSFEIEGTGSTRGIPTVNLLTAADAFATTCANSAKIAWTTDLATSYVVTENSSFAMSVKATAANSLEFSDGNDNDILLVGSGPPRIYLTVTN
ncbi:hypothetical protein OAS32_06155 [Candidatus Pseudothioglobus singularis]|nr:hypothetical protein [Candidatus Pseudothioglobus singularis]